MKTIGIEAFLQWVYRNELPKAEAPKTPAAEAAAKPRNGWAAVARQGELMVECVSDGRVNSYGVVPLSAWYGEPPHPDAMTAHEAVSELATMALDVPEDWSPLAGLGLSDAEAADAVRRALPRISLPDEDGNRRLRFKPAELVRRFAILGGAPGWEAEKPKARYVLSRGMPAWFRIVNETIGGREFEREVDGFNTRSRRPFPDAYRKTVLEPDPAQAAIERAEFEVWHAALCLLVEMLSVPGLLTGHALQPPVTPARPWEANALLENTP